MKGDGYVPNRLLKESICRSEEIDSLSWLEEVLFYRLIVSCDDFGRFDARTKIIKGHCFPLKDITEKDIDKALYKLSSVGLIRVYEAQGRPILQLVTWERHQTVRAKKSKYPSYDENCKQMYSDDCNDTIKHESGKDMCYEPTEPDQPPVITLQLNTGEEYPITREDVDRWSELYPAVDIMQELRKMKGWCMDNPKKRKTKNGIKRFIGSWLSKEQDKGGTPGYRQSGKQHAGYDNRLDALLTESRGDLQ